MSFLIRNSYALVSHVPWTVSFVTCGDLSGRASVYFDSSEDVSLELLKEWRDFHVRRAGDNAPQVTVHFPLDVGLLQKTLGRLGAASGTLAQGTLFFLSLLKSKAPFIEACYVPVAMLANIKAEIDRSAAAAAAGTSQRPLTVQVHGAWISDEPQSPWSRRHVQVDGDHPNSGYLSYAPVFGGSEQDWKRTALILGPDPTPPSISASRETTHFASLSDWLQRVRSFMRVVPILSSDNEREFAIECQEAAPPPPRGIIVVGTSAVAQGRDLPNQEWWTLGESRSATLRVSSSL